MKKKIRLKLSKYNTLLLKYYSELYELLEQLRIPLFLLVFILFVGTSGYMILSKGNFIDSFYMTVITVATIGFGELVEGSDTPVGRVFTSFLSLGGIGFYTTSITLIVNLLFRRDLFSLLKYIVMLENISKLKDHFIIFSYNELAEELVKILKKNDLKFVLIDDNRENEIKLTKNPYVDYFIIEDMFDKEVLNSVNINYSKGAIILLNDKIKKLALLVTLRLLKPNKDEFIIYILASDNEEEEKYKSLGANFCIIPSKIISTRIISYISHQAYGFVSDLLDKVSYGEEKEIDIIELVINKDSILNNRKIADTTIRKKFKSTIIALKKGDNLELSIDPNTILQENDVVIIFGKYSNLKKIREAFINNSKELINIEQI